MEFVQLTQGAAFTPARRMLYYGQRLLTGPRLRRFVVARLTSRIRAREGVDLLRNVVGPVDEASLRSLRESGHTSLGTLLDAKQLADIHAFLHGKSIAEYRNAKRIFTPDAVPDGVRLADYSLPDVLDCPHILEIANSPSLLRLAAGYIGCKPTISGIGLRWSFPGSAPGAGLQAFHRDADDWRFIKVFVYLTDVDEGSGPHVYVRGSHLTKASARLRSYSNDNIQQDYGADKLVIVTGAAGFGFAVDTYGIHKGLVPTKRPRLMLQVQYSLLPVYAYHYKPYPYKGALQFDSYVNRLFLAT